jgi:energy-converting hydrogenase Eha subunit B
MPRLPAASMGSALAQTAAGLVTNASRSAFSGRRPCAAPLLIGTMGAGSLVVVIAVVMMTEADEGPSIEAEVE